jgi:nitroreductase
MTSAEATPDGRRPDGPAPPSRLLRELLEAAVAAPSMHNTQPWRFRIWEPGHVIELRIDPARMLPVADPQGRAAYIACGAALLNLRIAAAAAGWRPRVTLLQDVGQPLTLADVRLIPGSEPTSWEIELRAAIGARRTNREPFSGRAVPPGIRADLAEAAGQEGAILHFPGRDEAARLLHLAADAERAQLADPAYRTELLRWAGGYRDREGVPDRALGPASPEGNEPVREFAPGRLPGLHRYAWFEEHPQLAVLSVRTAGPPGWLTAGQALERAWLTATSRGIAVCPLTQPLETAGAWLVRDSRRSGEQPQMILRIGYGLPLGPGAPRRPVGEALDGPLPDEP